ncbi:MAG: 4-alpha-glucanotransferase [Deltaproteobacteria bacterium]|nr:4-alpha-glucanotransferase [Deltaproteobacteria bacterium]
MMQDDRPAIDAALALLGKRKLVLSIHDPSFPADARDDLGQGAATTLGAARFLDFAAAQGFTAVQLGPQGATTAFNPSPYDGTALSRSSLTIAPRALVDDGLVRADTLDALVAARPTGSERRADAGYAHGAMRALLAEARTRFTDHEALRTYRARHAAWLEDDARCAAALDGGTVDEDGYVLAQYLAERAHARLRERCASLRLKLYGDLQIGLSPLDVRARRSLLLEPYRMGAPPSRTNPEGQPWGYGVLDPAQYGDVDAPGPALQFVALRMHRMLSLYDGVRIDHPHGHCDPWVYLPSDADPFGAVQSGARLFSSPALPDHPALGRFSIARAAQLDGAKRRWDDGWVRDLDDGQVARYGVVLDVMVAAARRHGRSVDDLLCEVLSTLPYPLQRVMQRHGLGRFRVTQKASLVDAADVYRAENALPADWIMIGNHDTKPIWALVEDWQRTGALPERAAQLGARLGARPASPNDVAQAMLAELLASPAENVMIFFSDLLGYAETYNRPGVISDDNWRLRVEPDFERAYQERRRGGRALDVKKALAVALAARGIVAPQLIGALGGT